MGVFFTPPPSKVIRIVLCLITRTLFFENGVLDEFCNSRKESETGNTESSEVLLHSEKRRIATQKQLLSRLIETVFRLVYDSVFVTAKCTQLESFVSASCEPTCR